jgi:hypothetical protein
MSDQSNQDEFASIDELEAVMQQDAAPDTTSTIPEKYRGKSADDLMKIVLDQERFIGRQAEEVGFARKMAEEAVKVRELASGTKPQDKAATSLDDLTDMEFFDNPKEAVKRVVENHPDILRARQETAQMRAAQAQATIRQRHSDVGEIVQDPEFAQWVQGNSTRMRLLQEAENNYDVDAADELLNNFKMQRKMKAEQTDQKQAEIRNTANDSLRAAQVDSGSRPNGGRKLIRRADIIELQKVNPAKYAALQDEILRAYAEGRVVDRL